MLSQYREQAKQLHNAFFTFVTLCSRLVVHVIVCQQLFHFCFLDAKMLCDCFKREFYGDEHESVGKLIRIQKKKRTLLIIDRDSCFNN